MGIVVAMVLASGAANNIAGRTALSPEQVTAQLRLITESPDLEVRKKASARLAFYARSWAVRDAIPALEKLAVASPDDDVRGWCLVAIAKSAAADGQRIPAIVLDSVYDEYAGVYPQAFHAWDLFAPFEPQAVRALIRFAHSPDKRHRSDASGILATYASHSKDAVNAIRFLTTDSDIIVRNNAHAALFRLTDNLDDFFPFILGARGEFLVRPVSRPEASPEQKTSDATWSFLQHGYASRIADWVGTRPLEMRDGFVKALAHRDDNIRRGATSCLRQLATNLDSPSYFAAPPATFAEEAALNSQRVRAAVAMVLSATLRDRLGEMADCDTDVITRKLAGDAISWAKSRPR